MAATPTIPWVDRIKALSAILDIAATIYAKSPSVETLQKAKEIVEKAIEEENKKYSTESTAHCVWRWTKKIVSTVVGGAGVILVATAAGLAAPITVPIGLASAAIVYVYVSSGKTMYQIWEETNAVLSTQAEQRRVYDDAAKLLNDAKCPIDLAKAIEFDATGKQLAQWLSNNSNVMAAAIEIGKGRNVAAAKLAAGI